MAYTYNATTDYIRFSDDSALENLHKGAFTCACWAKQDGNQYYQRYFARAGGSTTRDWDLSGKNQSYRRLIMKIFYSTTNAYAESVDNTVPNNVWNHLCATWDGSGIPTLYANGTEPSYLTQTSPAGTRQDSTGVYLYIGNLDTHTRAPSADMHSNALWNVELSADEVAALANGISPLFIRPTNLVFYTPLTNHANDIIGERAPETVSGATGGAEQNITVYGGPIYVPSAAAAVGAFEPQFAARSTITITPGRAA